MQELSVEDAEGVGYEKDIAQLKIQRLLDCLEGLESRIYRIEGKISYLEGNIEEYQSKRDDLDGRYYSYAKYVLEQLYSLVVDGKIQQAG